MQTMEELRREIQELRAELNGHRELVLETARLAVSTSKNNRSVIDGVQKLSEAFREAIVSLSESRDDADKAIGELFDWCSELSGGDSEDGDGGPDDAPEQAPAPENVAALYY